MAHHNHDTTSKYRPSLTASQIAHIISMCHSENPISPESVSVIAKLTPFLAKIEVGALAPAYTHAHSPSKPRNPEGYTYETTYNFRGVNYPDKESYWAACYEWSQTTAHRVDMSLPEIQGANEHRYLNDLMSPEEMEVFEADILRL